MERIEGLVAEGQALTAAYRVNYAFADGAALKREYDRWQASLELAPGETPGTLTAADDETIVYIVGHWPRRTALVS